jgi:hypothetical protein
MSYMHTFLPFLPFLPVAAAPLGAPAASAIFLTISSATIARELSDTHDGISGGASTPVAAPAAVAGASTEEAGAVPTAGRLE